MLYKLTDEKGQTRHKTQWGEGISHTATGTSTELCSDGVIHAYENPLVAAFIHPLHVEFKNPILWEAEGEVIVREGQLKCGCKTLTTLKKIPLPKISTEQRIEIAIRCAQLVSKDDPAWNTWAEKWLSGEDRSRESADAAAHAAYHAAYYAAYYAASAAAADYAADYTAAAAYASYAALSAAFAADAAAWADADFDLAGIIEKVLKV